MIGLQAQRQAKLIFDVEDLYARDRGVRGRHPRPMCDVNFHLVAKFVEGARQDIDPPWKLLAEPNPSGYHVFFGKVELPDGRRRSSLSEGTYVVRVESDFYQHHESDNVVHPQPATPISFDLKPGYLYPFPSESTLAHGKGLTLLRGCAFQQAGDGMSGVTVEVNEALYSYTTDESGQWVLVFPDDVADGNINVRFVWPDRPATQVDGVPLVQGVDNSLSQTALRGWVLNQNGAPLRGATVEVQGLPGTVPTRADGAWFYFFNPTEPAQQVSVEARLPDDSSQVVAAVQVQPRATVVVPTFRFP